MVSQINSKLDERHFTYFNDLLTHYNIDNNIVFEHMYELNTLLPDNIHTFCTINTDGSSPHLRNVLPVKYGVLEIIKGYNAGFCTFILHGFTTEQTFIYTSRYRGKEETSDKWRKVMWEYVN